MERKTAMEASIRNRVRDAIDIDPARRTFRIARSSYVDADIYRAEMETIFSSCWLYVGHASELAAPGDFKTRSIAGRSVIFVRDGEGAIRCFLNICPHRGAQVCREREGSTNAFHCIYHGWSFGTDGDVLHVAEEDTYADGFATAADRNLVAVPRFEEYRGFWFLNFDADAVSLRDYLGDACVYIDRVVDQAELGMETVGAPQEYSMRANWKLLAENSTDILHVETLHPTYLDLIRTNSEGQIKRGKMEGNSIDLGNGHSVVEREATYGRPIAKWISLWGEDAKVEIDGIYQRLTDRYGEEIAKKMATYSRNLLIFPNLVINDIMSLTIRTFQPTAVDYMEISVWSLAPVEERGTVALERRLTNFLEFLGPAGFATPDDVEALESCHRAFAANREAPWNDLSKGFHDPAGDTIGETKDEVPQRAFWRGWQQCLENAERLP
jgi:p-cumate 2,3-dioxygenase alpha subunit